MNDRKENERECPSCALMCSADEKECPYCGYEFPHQQKGMTIAAWAFIALIILWLIARF